MTHRWKFFRAGGFDQVQLETGADLMHLDELDLKLWVALACPATGIEFDAATAALVDTDHDGRIRAPELIAAVKWAGTKLRDPDLLLERRDALEFSAIADPGLLASAQQICTRLGRTGATSITLAEVTEAARLFAEGGLNGDGIVTTDSARDDDTRTLVHEMITCMGGVPDRSGKPGIDQARADAFFAECAAFGAWHQEADARRAEILPLGEQTAFAARAVRAIRAKVDDYFGRCRLAAFDPRAVALLNRREEEYLAVAAQDLSITAAEVAGFPLAQVAPGRPLSLESGINPAHAAAVGALHAEAVKPLLGDRKALTEADWLTVLARLEPFERWSAEKKGAAVEGLGRQRVRDILAGPAREALAALIAREKSFDAEAGAIGDVEKLLRFKRDLYLLCTNFVSFRDFYDAGEPAIFQAGTLFLDQRSCTLTLPVHDVGRHAAMASLAGSYLAYCDCMRKGTSEKRQIVAAFTNGDADDLMVGRNGVFYDRQGRDWDATIIKIIENPISLRQAFWSPYKRLVRMIEEQVARRAAAADAAVDVKTVTGAAGADKARLEGKKVDVGTVAALGVAFGALATAFAALAGYLSGLLKLPFWQVCLAVAGLLLIVSGPSLVIAWLKLRKRNLGPLLDANGWAVNARARLNVPFGASLTGVAKLPQGAVLSSNDRFGEKRSPWPGLVMFVIVVAFLFSLLNHFYVLDGIWYQLTGTHNPAWFRQAPGAGG